VIYNFQLLNNNEAIELLPIKNSNWGKIRWSWIRQKAYFFTGLTYPMLVCPFPLTYDEMLVERPGIYFKTNLPLGGMFYFSQLSEQLPDLSTGININFLKELVWIADSYLFKLNSITPLSSSPRLYVDYSNNHPNRGQYFYDNARILAKEEIKQKIDSLHGGYTEQLRKLITSNPGEIEVCNYNETSLIDEICTHSEIIEESLNYLKSLINNDPNLLDKSRLTKGFEHIENSLFL